MVDQSAGQSAGRSAGQSAVCHLVVDVQLVVLPGLQRLINSSVTLHGGVGQDGTSAEKHSDGHIYNTAGGA